MSSIVSKLLFRFKEIGNLTQESQNAKKVFEEKEKNWEVQKHSFESAVSGYKAEVVGLKEKLKTETTIAANSQKLLNVYVRLFVTTIRL